MSPRGDPALPVGGEQIGEAGDGGLQIPAHIGIPHQQAAAGGLEQGGGGKNIGVFLHSGLPAGESLMGHQLQPLGTVDQSIPGDAGGFVIRFAEAAGDPFCIPDAGRSAAPPA